MFQKELDNYVFKDKVEVARTFSIFYLYLLLQTLTSVMVKTIVMTMPPVQIPLALTTAPALTDSKATVHTAKVGEKYFSLGGYAYTMANGERLFAMWRNRVTRIIVRTTVIFQIAVVTLIFSCLRYR